MHYAIGVGFIGTGAVFLVMGVYGMWRYLKL
jgi:hypothetical protein